MTNEQKQIAIAEAHGWKNIQKYIRNRTYDRIFILKGDYGRNKKQLLPDYLNDLNAMHKAEALLRSESSTWDAYCKHLFSVCSRGHPFRENNIVGATASQRADAFLKTIGKL